MRGFTLIEILVVVVLIAISATLVSVQLAPNQQRTLRNQADKLAVLLEQARDEAIGTGASLAFQADAQHYWFARRQPDRTWGPFVEEPFGAQVFPAPVQLVGMEINGRPAAGGDLIIFSPVGNNPTFRIHLAAANARLQVRSAAPASIVVEGE